MSAPFVPILHGAALDRPDEQDTILTAQAIAGVLARRDITTEIIAVGLDLTAIGRLAARQPLAVFNLVEALDGSSALSPLALSVLDHFGLAYTGTRTAPYVVALSKLSTKSRLRAHGLPTAGWWEAGAGVPTGRRVIVKSESEHASVGIDQDSVVDGRDAAAEIARRESRFGGKFFAEAFLPGREFNIAVLEVDGAPRVLPVPEITFDMLPAGHQPIVDYDAKWEPGSAAYHLTPRCFGLEAREPDLAARLATLARQCWSGFELSGYARIDVRLDATGEPMVLEVNANPCLAPDAGFAATAAEAGISYDDVVMTVLSAATRVPARATRTGASPTPEGHNPDRARSLDARRDAEAEGALSWREAVEEADIERVRQLVAATEMFNAEEVAIAAELVEERVRRGPVSGYEFLLAEGGGALVGYACYGPTPATEGTFDLYWIVVSPDAQGNGIGRAILECVEDAVRSRGGCRLYVDTSSTGKYVPTRAFYDRTGFRKVAELTDFYREGDGKVVFMKGL